MLLESASAGANTLVSQLPQVETAGALQPASQSCTCCQQAQKQPNTCENNMLRSFKHVHIGKQKLPYPNHWVLIFGIRSHYIKLMPSLQQMR